MTLGNRADVATVNSYFGGTTMNAGSGDDDVVAGGFDATASGEAGDDTIRLAADSGTFGFGGPGDDRLTGARGAYDVELGLAAPDGTCSCRTAARTTTRTAGRAGTPW